MTSFGHRAPLLWLVLPFLVGLAAGKIGLAPAESWSLAGAAIAVALALLAAWRAPRWWPAVIALAMLLAGSASYALHRHRLPTWDSLPPREARLTLRIERMFQQTRAHSVYGLAVIVRADEPVDDLPGQRIYFSFTLVKNEEPPARSAIVAARGVISTLPRNPAAETFEAYLADAGVNFRFARAHILALERSPSAWRRFCERLAQRMSTLLGAGLERRPELAAIFRAMMLGQKHELSEAQDQLFMNSGTMHLFAINGLHIGVVALSMHALLALLRCPRRLASVLVLAVLWLDVDTTGASPSAVRAFLMVAVFEAAWALRRPGNALAALAASALLVLLIDPLDFFRASFQMSYGVVTAILTLGLPLAERMQNRLRPFKDLPEITWRRWQHAWAWSQRGLIAAFGIGLSATLVSTLTGAEFFHVIAPAGLVANLALVPLASLVIAAGFTSLVFGLSGAAWISQLFNHAAALLIRLIETLIRWGTRLPCTHFATHYRSSWIAPAALAALMAACLAGYANGWRRDRGGWWPPFAVVALALIFGVKFG